MKKIHLPPWLRHSLPQGKGISAVPKILRKYHLESVCERALCPNRTECFAKKRATFLALGPHCTRSCSFCNVGTSSLHLKIDPSEPQRIASAVAQLSLKHVVITMVSRDDLPDGGASHMANILRAIRNTYPSRMEVLTSDLLGNTSHLDLILQEKPDIFNHNLETTRRLTPKIRSHAQYERSLYLLWHAKRSFLGKVKSGLMVGLGETKEEVEATLSDLHKVGCDIVTIGQYLQPSPKQMKVCNFISPKTFQEYEHYGHALGIPKVVAAPFVRSSYCAEEVFLSF